MVTRALLNKIGFAPEDADFVLEKNEKYASAIQPIATEYLSGIQYAPFVPYDGDGRAISQQKADLFIKQVQEEIPGENKFVLNLLAWLNCIPLLHRVYEQYGISDDVFYDSMKDFSYKANECKRVYGVCGLFVNWFFLFFDLKEVALGRLQFEVFSFGYENYFFQGTHLKEGDRVYSCHIPSSGKLTMEECLTSFQQAYEFFRTDLSGDIIPIVCHSWLLYPPYAERVFPKESNLQRFAQWFEIIDTTNTGKVFDDSWRVFNKMYVDTTEDLPSETTLQRNFIEYIRSGGDFGYSYGIILYNGKEKRIING